MVEVQDGLEEARYLRKKLEEMHTKMRENVKSKLDNYLDSLLGVPSEDKYHWCFSLKLYPRYVNEFTNVGKLNEIETVGTSTIINEIMPKFYDYIMAAEL